VADLALAVVLKIEHLFHFLAEGLVGAQTVIRVEHALVAAGAGHGHVQARFLAQAHRPRREFIVELQAHAVGRGGAAAVPVFQLDQLDV